MAKGNNTSGQIFPPKSVQYTPHTEPLFIDAVVEDTSNVGASDNGVLAKEQRLQYQFLVGPVMVAEPTPDTTPPWTELRPVQVHNTFMLSACHGPYFFAGTIAQETVAEWLPILPHKIEKKKRKAHFAPYFGGFGIPAPESNNTDATTKIGYPAIVRRNKIHPSRMMWEASPNPAVEIARVGQFVDLSWQPEYADRIWRRTAHAAELPFYVGPSISIFPITPLSWNPEYPDRIYRQKLPTAAQRFLAFVGEEQGTAVPNYWLPRYPVQLNRKTHHPSRNIASVWVRFIDDQPDIVPDLAFFPDYIYGKRWHPAFQPRGIDMWAPIFAVTPTALTTYPDRIPRFAMPPSQMQFATLAFQHGVPHKELSWEPKFPHRANRNHVHVSFMPVAFQELQAVQPFTDLSWAPEYPDWLAVKNMLAANQLAFVLGSYGTISQPELAWKSIYPDRHQYPTLRTAGVVANLEPIPDPELVDLSWRPDFVASVFRPTTHAAKMPSSWWNTITPAPTPLGWDVQHQMPVRRVLRPSPFTVSGFDLTSSWPLGWAGYQPEYINQRRMNERPALFGPPWSTQPAIAQLHWLGDQQTFMPRLRLRPNGWYSPLTAAPDIIAAGVVCIHIHDQDVYWASHYNTSVRVSTLTNETLTPTIEGDIC